MEGNIRLDWSALVQEAIRRRKAQGLTQEQLAVLAGISKPTLNNFEQERKNITVDRAFKILNVLGLLTTTQPH